MDLQLSAMAGGTGSHTEGAPQSPRVRPTEEATPDLPQGPVRPVSPLERWPGPTPRCPAQEEEGTRLTWITLPYWITVPSNFLFSVSFCFFSKSAACCGGEGRQVTTR